MIPLFPFPSSHLWPSFPRSSQHHPSFFFVAPRIRGPVGPTGPGISRRQAPLCARDRRGSSWCKRSSPRTAERGETAVASTAPAAAHAAEAGSFPHLVVHVFLPHGGLQRVQQSVHQAFAFPQSAPSLCPVWAHVSAGRWKHKELALARAGEGSPSILDIHMPGK